MIAVCVPRGSGGRERVVEQCYLPEWVKLSVSRPGAVSDEKVRSQQAGNLIRQWVQFFLAPRLIECRPLADAATPRRHCLTRKRHLCQSPLPRAYWPTLSDLPCKQRLRRAAHHSVIAIANKASTTEANRRRKKKEERGQPTTSGQARETRSTQASRTRDETRLRPSCLHVLSPSVL